MPSPTQPELIPPASAQTNLAEQARKEAARIRLAEYLKDPAFRAIEGFPIGSDEDILALSDPPYYTACPNPFLPEIIAEWRQEREKIRKELKLSDERYQREPFAADVSEGKNDPIYNAHSYHTKVPHKAIMRYILHYTDPGDIVFDGFCGTGMTGVAAQLCGDKKAVEELGYRVDEQGLIWDQLPSPGIGRGTEGEGQKPISRLGARKAVLNDLSPAATFIAYNYNTPVDTAAFEREAKRILKEVEQECGWMYETWHPNCDDSKRVKGEINYTVWSDVFVCPNCGTEIVFWNVAVDQEKGIIYETWNCPGCSTQLAKSPSRESGALKVERAWETQFDRELKQIIRKAKQVPVMINYSVGKKRFQKLPDTTDLELIHKISENEIPHPIPIDRMPEGSESRRNDDIGLTHIHHYYTRRNIWVLAYLFNISKKSKFFRPLLYILTGISQISCKQSSFRYDSRNPQNTAGGILKGTLYVPSIPREGNIFKNFERRLSAIVSSIRKMEKAWPSSVVLTRSSSNNLNVNKCFDYIFIDPPFGNNLMYSELNFFWETWLRVFTNNLREAIINNIQHKGLVEYQGLMQVCFNEFFRVLKEGRWMTIEFHNSQNSVWNAIQETLQRAGFVIADVRVLDKQGLSFKQVTTTTAVKQDLIISAYKPNGNLEERFKLKAGSEDGAWEFVRYHLGKLPITNITNGNLLVNAERQAFLLFDRMVAFHIQRGVMVPISAPEFYAGLQQHFIPRNGMYFLPEQVMEYDRALLDAKGVVQLSLFVTEEKSAIQWLRQQLDPSTGGQPQTHADLNPKFKLVLHQLKHEKAPELIDILGQNFLQDAQGKWYMPDHNKASDLEQVRQRSLLREFSEYVGGTGRLRQFRTEAVRAGFADAYKRQEYDPIIKVADRLPEDVLREDPDLLMYYDSAMLRKK